MFDHGWAFSPWSFRRLKILKWLLFHALAGSRRLYGSLYDSSIFFVAETELFLKVLDPHKQLVDTVVFI
jgi:hypothetical protein